MQLHVELGQAELLLDVTQHAGADLDVVAGELAVAEREAQRARGLAHAHRDAAAVLDLLQRIGVGAERDRGGGQRDGLNEHRLLHGDSCG